MMTPEEKELILEVVRIPLDKKKREAVTPLSKTSAARAISQLEDRYTTDPYFWLPAGVAGAVSRNFESWEEVEACPPKQLKKLPFIGPAAVQDINLGIKLVSLVRKDLAKVKPAKKNPPSPKAKAKTTTGVWRVLDSLSDAPPTGYVGIVGKGTYLWVGSDVNYRAWLKELELAHPNEEVTVIFCVGIVRKPMLEVISG